MFDVAREVVRFLTQAENFATYKPWDESQLEKCEERALAIGKVLELGEDVDLSGIDGFKENMI